MEIIFEQNVEGQGSVLVLSDFVELLNVFLQNLVGLPTFAVDHLKSSVSHMPRGGLSKNANFVQKRKIKNTL